MAAPTSQNEVTVRRLTSLITGLWTKIKSLVSEAAGSKADKVTNATSGNFAGLDENGNLTDSGSKASDFKTVQEAVSDPSASGTGLTFISGISQDTNGVISPAKGTVQNATTTQKGVVQLTNSIGNGTTTNTATTPKAVKEALDAAIASAYHAAGTKTCAELVSSLLVAANEGAVYNMTDSGTTTVDFVEGAGKPIHEGDNVVVCKVSSSPDTYKFDLLSGFVDLSNYIQKSGTAGLVKNDGTIDTTSYSPTTHTHSVKVNGTTKTIPATGGTVVELMDEMTETEVQDLLDSLT